MRSLPRSIHAPAASRHFSWTHLLTVFLLLNIVAPQAGHAAPIENYDRRQIDLASKPAGVRKTAAAVAAVSPAAASATAQLAATVRGLRVDRDPILHAPKFIASSRAFLSGPAGVGGTVNKAALAALPAATDGLQPVRAFVNTYSGLFGFHADLLAQARVIRDDTTAATGLRTVVWQQELDGLPIFESTFKSSLSAKGELMNVGSAFLADPAAAANHGTPGRASLLAKPPVTAAAALAAAAATVGPALHDEETVPADEPVGAGKLQHFKAKFHLKGAPEAQLVWLPMDAGTLRLCWKTLLTTRANLRMYEILVDAQTGEVLVRHNASFDASPATYNVFVGDSPTPMQPGLSTPGTAQPPAVSRLAVTLTSIDANASPEGWIPDGGNILFGNNAEAYLDENGDGIADANSSPSGSPARDFDFPLDLTQDPAPQAPASTTNLFYWTNLMHDVLYGYGFTESAGNFQHDNFSRGGTGGDSVQAENLAFFGQPASDSTRNNAFFSVTGTDGKAPYMEMFIWDGPTPNRNGSFDATIVCHEYTHGLSTRLVGGGTGISQLATRGMGEGWSDFVALSVLSNANQDIDGNLVLGGYATYQSGGVQNYPNYYFGGRRYPYSTDVTKNPLTFKDTDPNQASSHTGVAYNPNYSTNPQAVAAEVHSLGEVWCMALLEARANLIRKLGYAQGSPLALQLVIDGMKAAPANPNFVQARDAIYQAEMNDTQGTYRHELENGFAKRGLGTGATAPDSSTTTGVVESFAESNPPDVTITSPVDGSFITGFTTLTGTAEDDGSGILGNLVNLTLVDNASGQYWNGSDFSSTLASVSAKVNADHTWTYSGALPSGATLRQGSYTLSVVADDNDNNISVPQAGVSQVQFTVDSVPPAVAVLSPANGSTITSDYAFGGTASDDGGGTLYVFCFIGRSTDDAYWDGSSWGAAVTPLPSSYDPGTKTWYCTAALPAVGGTLANGPIYQFSAIAQDAAGNATTASNLVMVDYHRAVVWTGATLHDSDGTNDSNSWDTAANWNPAVVPGADDNVSISTDAVDLVTDRTVHSLTLTSGSINNHTVTVTGAGSVFGGGVMNGTTLNVQSGATLAVNTSGGPQLSSVTLNNAGTVTVGASDPNNLAYFDLYDSALNNQSGGVLQVARDGTVFRYLGGASVINNAGTFTKTVGTGTSDFGGVPLQSMANASVGAATGTLSVNSGATFGAGTQITGPGTVVLTSGTTFTGQTTVTAALHFQSGMTFNAATLVQGAGGTLSWDTSTFTGTLNIPAGGTLAVNTSGGPQLTSGTLNNAGTITVGASDVNNPAYFDGYDSTLNNQSGGLVQVLRDGTAFRYLGGNMVINNLAGARLLKTTVASGRTEVDWTVANNGTVEADAGTLALAGGSGTAAAAGVFNAAAASAHVEFGGGTHILKAGAHFTGAGSVLLTSGELTLTGAVNVGASGVTSGGFVESAGTLDGAGSLNVPSGVACRWNGGLVSTTYNVQSGATLAVSTTGGPQLNGGTLNNAGTVTVGALDANNLAYLDLYNSTINNQNGGVFQLARDGTVLRYLGGASSVNNVGTFTKTAGTGTSDLSGVPLLNQANGSVGAAKGTLSLTGGVNFLAGSKITGPGAVVLGNGATFTGQTTVTAALHFQSGMTFNAATLVQGAGGTLSWDTSTFTGTLNIPAGGTLAVNTSGGPQLTSGTLNNAGTITVGASDVNNPAYFDGYDSTLNNQSGGLVQVLRDGTAFRYLGGNMVINNLAGARLLKTTVASGRTEVDWTVANNGTVEADAGTLALAGGSGTAAAAGVFNAAAASAHVEFGGGTHILKAGAHFTGAGSVLLTSGELTLTGAVNVGASGVTSGGFVESAGTLDGAGSLNVPSGVACRWNGGLVSTTYNVQSGATLAVSTTGGPQLNGGTLNNAGTVTVGALDANNLAYLDLYNSTINNQNGGVFQLARDGTVLRYLGGIGAFNNTGTLAKTAGTGTSDLGGVTLDNRGTISAPAGKVLLLSGDTTVNADSQLTGTGKVSCANLTLNAALAVATGTTLEFGSAGGTLTGTANAGGTVLGVLNGPGNFRFVGNTITGKLNLGATLNTTIDTTNSPQFNGLVLNHAGTMTITGGAGTLDGSTTTFNNLAGATIQVLAPTTLRNIGTVPSFVNAGTVRLGPTPEILTMGWTFSQAGGGLLDLFLDGTNNKAAPQFSQVNLTADALPGGTLRIDLGTGYLPKHKDTYQILTFTAAPKSNFAQFLTPNAPTGTTLTKQTSATGVVVTAAVVPKITSALAAAATEGTAFSYQIAATQTPTSYAASGLPAGLAVNTTTGLISGKPTVAGTFTVGLTATNSAGSGTASLALTVKGAAPVITSATSATANVGVSFTYQIAATNTPTSYGASGLPAGLTVSTSTGKISGTPTKTGTYPVTVTATNATGTGSATLALTVKAIPVITSAATATGNAGSSFTYQITATNTPTSYGATGLPAGLSVSTSTGKITGTPTKAGTYAAALSATNASGTGTANLTFTIQSVPVITSATTAAGKVGVSFTYQITATNSPASYTATGLPTGLTVTAGKISGTPTKAGAYTVALTATNASGTGKANLALTIAASAPVITSAKTATGKAGSTFSYQIVATNSPTGYTAAPLPAGLKVSATGLISGTPTAVATTAVTLTASNSAGKGTATLTITISKTSAADEDEKRLAASKTGGTSKTGASLSAVLARPQIVSVSVAEAQAGKPFSYRIAVNTEARAFAASGLPHGLEVDPATGMISGTPVELGTFPSKLTAEIGQETVTGSLTLIVGDQPVPAPVVTSALAVDGQVGTVLTYQVTAANHPTSFAAEGLPEGLSIDAASGVVSGAPVAAGEYPVVLSATNQGGTGSAGMVLTVSLPPLPVVSAVADIAQASIGGETAGKITLSIPAALAEDLVVSYEVKGSAINGVDYRLLKGTRTIKAGRTTAAVKIVPQGDLAGEGRKVVRFVLEPGENYEVGTSAPLKVEILAGK